MRGQPEKSAKARRGLSGSQRQSFSAPLVDSFSHSSPVALSSSPESPGRSFSTTKLSLTSRRALCLASSSPGGSGSESGLSSSRSWSPFSRDPLLSGISLVSPRTSSTPWLHFFSSSLLSRSSERYLRNIPSPQYLATVPPSQRLMHVWMTYRAKRTTARIFGP